MRTILLLSAGLLGLSGCDSNVIDRSQELPVGTTAIPRQDVRLGDAERGYDFLVNGSYVSSGIPIEIFQPLAAGSEVRVPGRTEANADLPAGYTAVETPEGATVAAPNCLTCHVSTLMGETVVGLGRVPADFSIDGRALITAADLLIRSRFGENSPQWAAYQPFRTSSLATAPLVRTDNRIVNPADVLFLSLIAFRDPGTMTWSDPPVASPPEGRLAPVPTDVPPWWVVKKKHALYYTSYGRGDLAKVIMASALLTARGRAELDAIEPHLSDLLAYIHSVESPPYPGSINLELAATGQDLFEANCSECHGTYGDEWTYPNLLVAPDRIGTDPLLIDLFSTHQPILDNYRSGWFGEEPNAARLVAERGYVAPPLDGIWASAPYFHNGSVPTVAGVLDPSIRPDRWRWSFDTSDYDHLRLGWNVDRNPAGRSSEIYDTSLPGYRNQGHTFAVHLSTVERSALIEYLKTL